LRTLGCVILLASAIVLWTTKFATAHPMGFSGLRVEVQPKKVHAAMTLHTRDLSAWFPPGKFPDYVNDVCREIERTAGEIVEIQFDAKPAQVENVRAFSPEVGMIELDVDYVLPSNAKTILVWSKCLPLLPQGHQQLLVVEDARGGKAQTLVEDTLAVDHDSAEGDIPSLAGVSSTQPTTAAAHSAPTSPPRRISFFLLGIEHIVTGYDHLLFLAALDLVRLPARIVEPAIAASIVYVGLENIFGKHRFAWRAAITFAFGLVHGLGFAAALREVGLGSTSVGIVMPLVKFSVGLETGQLCIAAVLLKILLTLRKRTDFRKQWVPAGSVLVSLIGAYWLIVRVMQG
jgi:hydrogenase/urease accessory protein HupE